MLPVRMCRDPAHHVPRPHVAMPDVFVKLNLKDQRELVVLNAPQSFEAALNALKGVRVARTIPGRGPVAFALAFVTRQAEVDTLSQTLSARAPGDALLWFAYPKGTSKRYACEFNRDTGWRKLRRAGFDTVRQIAIDEDWTALRFRREEFIKRQPLPNRAAAAR
jgi:hypothetical protein